MAQYYLCNCGSVCFPCLCLPIISYYLDIMSCDYWYANTRCAVWKSRVLHFFGSACEIFWLVVFCVTPCCEYLGREAQRLNTPAQHSTTIRTGMVCQGLWHQGIARATAENDSVLPLETHQCLWKCDTWTVIHSHMLVGLGILGILG